MQNYARAFLIQVALSPLAWLVAFIVTGSTRARRTGADAMTRPPLLIIALLLALTACGGGGNDAPPYQLTIEARCTAGGCPVLPTWDGTDRPTAVTTPNPALPTSTPPPLTAAEALATQEAPAAMTAAAGGMAARATEGATTP